MNQHPHLKELYKKYLSETQSFRKVHRMIDWFESLIKTHTVVILAEYVRCNKFSENAKLLLSQGLFTPTLGIWRRIGQDLFKELEGQETFTWTVPEFREEYQNLLKALEKKDTNVIELRNFYAHGATPYDEVCEKHIRQLEPFLHQLTQLKWLEQSSTIVKNGLVYLESTHGELCLHPVLLYRKENSGSPLAFFNDLKNDKVGLLNYPLSKYWKEENFYDEFQKNLPLNDWKRSNRESFEQNIDELTESFRGRKEELDKLIGFVKTKRKGYFSILGNPGIGKSTLIAQFVKELREQTDLTHLKVIEYFINRSTNGARPETFLNYLIQKTDDVFKEGKNIRADANNPWNLQEVLFAKWRAWSSKSQGRKLLFLIDGLDEGTDTDLLTYLPRENFDNILFIYGSRPGGQQAVKDFFHTLPIEHHIRHELRGLKKEDIRSLIYEVSNKYEIERESAWINEVLNRSKGYPLYIKLLCDAIVNGNIAFNDVDTLPKGIYEQYQRILDRYAKDIRFGNATLQCLYSLAAAKDYLNIHQLGRINHLDEVSKVQVGGILMEILSKKENLKDAPSFQLFHESFREYLLKEKKEEIEEAKERIIDFCGNWEELEGSKSQHYTLQHYASHLKESQKSKRKQELLQLLSNRVYIQTQKQVLHQFDSTRTILQVGLAEACKQKNSEVQLETALALVDLKYEEANDVNAVIDMVANGEIELALHRIESFGGQDREGLKRKFIVYMLCLAELTLLGSKEKPFRKTAIEALLNHLDHKLPTDRSLINWNDFFPSYLVFIMACELDEINIEFNTIYKRTDYWDDWWISNILILDNSKLKTLLKTCYLKKNEEISGTLMLTALEFIKYGNFEIVYKIALSIKVDWKKNKVLLTLLTRLAEAGKIMEAINILPLINDDYDRRRSLAVLINFSKILKSDISNKNILKLIITISKNHTEIKNENTNPLFLIFLSKYYYLSKQKLKAREILKESLIEIQKMPIEQTKNYTIEILMSELIFQEELGKAEELIHKNNIKYEWDSIVGKMVLQIARQGDLKRAFNLAIKNRSEINKAVLLNEILRINKDLAKRNKLSNIEDISIKNISAIILKIIDNHLEKIKIKIIKNQFNEQNVKEIKILIDLLYKIGNKHIKTLLPDFFLKVLSNINNLDNVFEKRNAILNLYELLNKSEKINTNFKTLKILDEIINDQEMYDSSQIIDFSHNLAKIGMLDKSFKILTKLKSKYHKEKLINIISSEIGKKRNLKEAFKLIEKNLELKIEEIGSDTKISIVNEVIKNEGFRKGLNYIEVIGKKGIHEWGSFKIVQIYLQVLSKNQMILEASKFLHECIIIVQNLDSNLEKAELFLGISIEFSKLGMEYESINLLNESFIFVTRLNVRSIKDRIINKIVIEYVRRKEIDLAIEIIKKEREALFLVMDLLSICANFSQDEKIHNIFLNEALIETKKIADINEKDKAIPLVVRRLAGQNKIIAALEIINEANSEIIKIESLVEVSSALAGFDKIDDANNILEFALGISLNSVNEIIKFKTLGIISIEFFKQKNMNKAIDIYKKITIEKYRKVVNAKIGLSLIHQKEFKKAIRMANKLDDNYSKDFLYSQITIGAALNGDWELSQETSFKIVGTSWRHHCWNEIGRKLKDPADPISHLELQRNLILDESRLYFIKGWAESLDTSEVDQPLLQQAIPYLIPDTDSLEIILQKYALHETFLGNSTREQLQRFNQSLNIQWALDIVDTFPKDGEGHEFSIN